MQIWFHMVVLNAILLAISRQRTIGCTSKHGIRSSGPYVRRSAGAALETTQHHRLAHVRGRDRNRAPEIGNGAREPERALARAPRDPSRLDDDIAQASPGRIRHTPALHAGIRQ